VCPKTREIFFNKIVVVMERMRLKSVLLRHLDPKNFSVTPAKDYELRNPYIWDMFLTNFLTNI